MIQIAIPISISRVNQFDAARLDVEMSAMLKEQLVKVFSLVKVLPLLIMVIWVFLIACASAYYLQFDICSSQDSCSNMSQN